MEDYIKDTLITSPYPFWLTVLIFALVTGLVQCIVFYFKEKGKNLATKEDIGDITKEIKSVESSFINETEKLKSTLAILTNLQTNIATMKINAITDYNKNLFNYLSLTLTGIEDITDNNSLEKYRSQLNLFCKQISSDRIIFELLIDDAFLKDKSTEIQVYAIEMDAKRQKDIIKLIQLNDEIQNIRVLDKSTYDIKAMLEKTFEQRHTITEMLYDDQMERYSKIELLCKSFQEDCRNYIYKLTNNS